MWGISLRLRYNRSLCRQKFHVRRRATPRYKAVVQFIRMRMARTTTSSHLATLRGPFRPFFPPSGTEGETRVASGGPVDRSRSRNKQAFVAEKRHGGNRLETTSGGGGGGHEEIASLPSNDVTTNANLITGPDIANRPGLVRTEGWGGGVASITARCLGNFQADRGAGEAWSTVSGNMSLNLLILQKSHRFAKLPYRFAERIDYKEFFYFFYIVRTKFWPLKQDVACVKIKRSRLSLNTTVKKVYS